MYVKGLGLYRSHVGGPQCLCPSAAIENPAELEMVPARKPAEWIDKSGARLEMRCGKSCFALSNRH